MSIELVNFPKSYEQCINLIKGIKQSNNRLQQAYSKLEGQKNVKNIKKEIQIEEQIVKGCKKKLEKQIDAMEAGYIDPQTSRKLNVIKKQMQNQNIRHIKLSALCQQKASSDNKQGKYRQFQKQYSNSKQTRIESEQSDGMQEYEFDYEHQRSMSRQKSQELAKAHKKLLYIQEISNQTLAQTYKQGQSLDIISENFESTLKNTQGANSYLTEAKSEQEKGQKKYWWLFAIIVIALILLALLLYLII